MSQNLQIVAEFQEFQLDNLVDFGKCCKTRIFLQKSVPIQPKTSNIFPKFCQKLGTTLGVRRSARALSVRCPPFFIAGDPPCTQRSLRGDKEGRHGRRFRKLTIFFTNFANFWRVRSRLYQNEILQENMRLTAFFKLFKICILLHRCNLKMFAKKSL